jgi:hypothetical protein
MDGVQYVYNNRGEKTSVIIPPIEMWEAMSSTKERKKRKDFLPSTYRGIYKGLKMNLEE